MDHFSQTKVILEALKNLNPEIPIIDFTDLKLNQQNYFYFPQFNKQVFELIKSLNCKEIIIVDNAYSLNSPLYEGFKIVQDHINLSTLNPLIGQIPPKFFAINNLYRTNDFSMLNRSIVVGLNPDIKPNEAQIQELLKAKATDYCFNLTSSALAAAFHGLKVVGLLKVNVTN